MCYALLIVTGSLNEIFFNHHHHKHNTLPKKLNSIPPKTARVPYRDKKKLHYEKKTARVAIMKKKIDLIFTFSKWRQTKTARVHLNCKGSSKLQGFITGSPLKEMG